MSLEHILLGMLRQPATGYDLGREFADGVAHFWYADRSQIYPTLKRLQKRGWLDSHEAPSQRGPRRRVYETTEAGREELRRWLLDGPHIGRERLAYVAQAFFLGELGDFEESLSVVERMRGAWEQRLGALEYIDGLIKREEGDWSELDVAGFHYYAALRLGLRQIRAKLDWCDETIDRARARLQTAAAPTRQEI